jgi:hypothetical protein
MYRKDNESDNKLSSAEHSEMKKLFAIVKVPKVKPPKQMMMDSSVQSCDDNGAVSLGTLSSAVALDLSNGRARHVRSPHGKVGASAARELPQDSGRSDSIEDDLSSVSGGELSCGESVEARKQHRCATSY